jgi:hypothetical protein
MRETCLWIGTLLLCAYTGVSGAQQRIIIVNGQLLTTAAEIAFVDALNCGQPVPSGNYWLNLPRREWGHVGAPQVNPLPDCTPSRSSSGGNDCTRRYRVYEDRMCYCYNVC